MGVRRGKMSEGFRGGPYKCTQDYNQEQRDGGGHGPSHGELGVGSKGRIRRWLAKRKKKFKENEKEIDSLSAAQRLENGEGPGAGSRGKIRNYLAERKKEFKENEKEIDSSSLDTEIGKRRRGEGRSRWEDGDEEKGDRQGGRRDSATMRLREKGKGLRHT
ncbi:hypothetical protein ACLOJK_012805 [Asimina triloba]